MGQASSDFGGGLKAWLLGSIWLAMLLVAYFLGDEIWVVGGAAVVGLAATGLLAGRIGKSCTVLVEAGREFLKTGEREALDGLPAEAVELLEEANSGGKELEFYKGAIQAVGNPLLVCNTDGRIVFVTDALLELIRKKLDQVEGHTVSEAFYNKRGDSVTESALSSGQSIKKDAELPLWDGRTVSVSLTTNLIRDSRRNILGAVSSFVDISATVNQEHEVRQEKDRLAKVGSGISELAQRVASASEELSASADEQARGAQTQKRQTDSVATSMEEMTSTVLEVARNASATSEAADEAQTAARDGVDLVSKAVDGINEVADSAEQLSGVLSALNGHAGEIGRIIGVINDIADQTNLLALNAAIEAARAGDAGRGFAVVADEVRKLAEKTMTATKEVEEAIRTIQTSSEDAMNSMQLTEKQVHASTDLSNKAGESLQEIMGHMENMASRIAQIATAAEQQSAAAEEINGSVEDIARISHEADEGAHQAAAATRDLAELAQELLNLSMEFTGAGHAEGPKFRSSDGEMKGVLLKIVQDFCKDVLGEAVHKYVQKELGDPVFLPTKSYPDTVMQQMAELAAGKTSKSPREIFLELGRYSVYKFHKMYRGYFHDETLKEFFLRMNDVHSALTKEQPGIKPPRFTYEDKGDVLFMTYQSKRALFDYFEGILRGAADFKGERIKLKMVPMDEKSIRAEITFQGKK
jgi:methyl-accepting chemotaxis protein